jgi:Lyzozyme M1 (1,4-beta-N-acetylmuramidase)
MNYDQLKQYAINNLWHGENSRERNRVSLAYPVASLLAQPNYSKVWGIDISHWDHNVQLDVTKALGAQFVFIKGLDGTLRTKYFPENRARAIASGLYQAPYVWLYPNSKVSCVAQAQEATKLLKEYPADLPLLLDFETTYYAGQLANPNFNDLRIWVTEFLRLGNRRPLLYSGKYYMDQFGIIPTDLKEMFEGLHIAQYGPNVPSLPLGYSHWELHQFSGSGDAMLIAPNDANKKELDLNYAFDQTTLDRLVGVITPPPDNGVTMKIGTVTVATLNIRSGPSTSNADIGDLLRDDQVIGELDPVTNWLHFGKIIRVNGTQENTDGWALAAYMTLKDYVPPAVSDLSVSITAGDDVVYEKQTVTITLKAKV